jgi:hypothetical protein
LPIIKVESIKLVYIGNIHYFKRKEIRMKTQKWKKFSVTLTVLTIMGLIFIVENAFADYKDGIPIQGRLTDANSNPLNGVYDITFRLYEDSLGETLVCDDTNSVTVEKGMFTSLIYGNCWSGSFDGSTRYLGIKVGSDQEMRPLQTLYAQPTAYSLFPPAGIQGNENEDAILDIENAGETGRGLRAYAMSETGVNYGVVGASRSPDGKGGYFYNTGSGVALHSVSDGVSFIAGGSGVIQSTAQSTLWISGNGIRKYLNSDTTIIDLDSIGGAFVKSGATTGNKNVMLPITIPGTLYGQKIRVTGIQIHWKSQTDLDGISAVLMRRQTGGVCNTCYVNMLYDTEDKVCPSSDNANGCITTYSMTSNNELSADSGVMYLTIELGFSGTNTYVEIGGVRLLLEHD